MGAKIISSTLLEPKLCEYKLCMAIASKECEDCFAMHCRSCIEEHVDKAYSYKAFLRAVDGYTCIHCFVSIIDNELTDGLVKCDDEDDTYGVFGGEQELPTSD